MADAAPTLLQFVLLAATTGCGMMAGLFGSFSSFVMKALAETEGAAGHACMQAINRKIIRPEFLGVFLGTGVLAVVAVILAWRADSDAVWPATSAAVLYVVACILSTIAFNVPLNNRLEQASPVSTAGGVMWQTYLVQWTRWNHVRAVATLIATPMFAWAAVVAQ